MGKIKSPLGALRQILIAAVLCLGMVLSTMTAAEAASVISGGVYNDYDNTANKKDFPVAGVFVALYDNFDVEIEDTQTAADGTYSFTVSNAGMYKVKIKTPATGYQLHTTAALNESAVTADGSTASGNNNLYLQGTGGKITGKVFIDKPSAEGSLAGLNDVYGAGDDVVIGGIIKVTLPNSSIIEVGTDGSGDYVVDHLPPGTYILTAPDEDEFKAASAGYWKNTSNRTASFSITMSGSDQTGQNFWGRPLNLSGIQGYTVNDQNNDNGYTEGEDLLLAGPILTLYHEDGTTLVSGVSPVTGSGTQYFEFKNLPIGNYVIKASSTPTGYTLTEPSGGNLAVILPGTTNPSAGNNFYYDPSGASLPGVSGYIFGDDDGDFSVGAGPDAGGTAYTSPSAGDVRFFNIKVELYRKVSGSWESTPFLTTSTSSQGLYRFRGLPANVDYKVVMDPSTVDISYGFMNDRDGKSIAKGNAPYEIKTGLTNLTSAQINQNFWFGKKESARLGIAASVPTINGMVVSGGTVNLVPSGSASVVATFELYEEDGVTRVVDSGGTIIPPVLANNTAAYVENLLPGRYIWKPVVGSYDSRMTPTSSADGVATGARPALVNQYGRYLFAGPVNVSGRIYVDQNGNDQYDDGIDTPMYGATVRIISKTDGKLWGYTGSAVDGTYNFTYLPTDQYEVHIAALTYLSGGLSSQIVKDPVVPVDSSNRPVVDVDGTSSSQSNQNIWYNTTNTNFFIQGSTWMDTCKFGTLEKAGANYYDSILSGTKVELLDDLGAVLDTKYTGADGKYAFTGLSGSRTYQVRASKDHLTIVDTSASGETGGTDLRTITFGATPGIIYDQDFLFLGQGKVVFDVINDLNFDGVRQSTEKNTTHYNYSIEQFINGGWSRITYYYNQSQTTEMPLGPGKYRIVPDNHTILAHKYPESGRSALEFTITGAGEQITDALFIETWAANAGAISSGSVWLDVNDNGLIDAGDIKVPNSGSETPQIGSAGINFYQSYLFHPDFNTASEIAAATAAGPLYTATIDAAGMYSQQNAISTNYLLHLDNLPSDYMVVSDIDGAAAPNQSWLPGFLNGGGAGVIQTPIYPSGITERDFLLRRTAPIEISGRVFYDANINTMYDAGDNPLGSVVIELYKDGTLLTNQPTLAADGTYRFTNLLDGNYEVRVTTSGIPSDYNISPDSVTFYDQMTINTSGGTYQERDFFFIKDGEAGISGRVAVDTNNSGYVELPIDQSGDLPLAGIGIDLYQGGTYIKSTTTNAKGSYSFIGGLTAGTYTVKLNGTGLGTYQAFLNATHTTPVDENQNIVLASSIVAKQDFLVVGNSNTNPPGGTTDPGAQNSGIQGNLFADLDADTFYTSGTDTPLTGVRIQLVNQGTGETLYGTTDSDGNYQFYNLSAGNYEVSLSSAISGYIIEGNRNGSATTNLTVTLGASGKNQQDFWFKTASVKGIEGYVYYDVFRDSVTTSSGAKTVEDVSLAGAVLRLYSGTGGSAVDTGQTVTTDATGKYSFPNLIYGSSANYTVKLETLPTGYATYGTSEKGTTAPLAEIEVLALPAAGVEGKLFFLTGLYSLGDFVWQDVNNDQSYTAGTDQPLVGIKVGLTWAGPDGVWSTADDVIYSTLSTTSSTGAYQFDYLTPGLYKVTINESDAVNLPILSGMGLIPEAQLAGNTNPQERTITTQNILDADFAYAYTGLISGKVTVDVDHSQSPTLADPNMTGSLTVRLEDSSNAANSKTLTTTDGNFSFIGVDSTKTWKISVSSGIATGYVFSFGQGDALNTAVGQEYATVALTTASPSKTDVVLGYKGSGKIQGKVVMDNVLTDGRVATGSDTSLGANIKVTISSTAPGFTSWTVDTLADGGYEITDLAPYAYTISIDKTQSGFQPGLVESFDPDSTEAAPTPPTGDGAAVVTLVSPTQILTQKDFGYKGRGSISGKILIDVEGGGTFTAADYSFGSAITVTATQGTITRTTTANAATGEYSFDTIPTGIWQVYVASSDLPAGYSFSYGEGSPSHAITVVADRVHVDIDSALTARSPVLKAVEVNLGYKGSAVIKGSLFYDNDDTDGNTYHSGVDTLFAAGYTVTLSGGSGFTARTTTTNASGEYQFTGLTPYADYKVTVASPTGYMVSFDPDSAVVTPPVIPVGDGEAIIPITTSTEVKTLQDFAFKGAGKIAGKIYIDLNDNGTFESAVDQPKSGITVTLTHPTLPSRTAVTDANGDYESTGIASGEWTATITGGTTGLRLPSFDYDDPFASSGSPATPLSAIVQITTGSLVEDHVDFGFINRGKLEGVIKEDTYASGIYDAAAPGIAGVTVYLVENDGVTPKTYADGSPIILTTDENGIFTARNLDCPTSGSQYSVRVEFGPNTTGPLSLMEPSYDSDTSGTGCGSGVNLAAGTHVVNADLADPLAMRAPTDLHLGYRASTGDIVIHKVAGKSTAKIGDIVPYTITIENMSDAPALNVTIEDLIPAGFKYVDGSTRLDGEKIEDPKGNRPLRFEEIDLGGASGAGTENSKRKLSYFLVVGSGVTQGEYTNSAIAKDQFNRNSSNVSQATVEITSDPLFDDSLIFGKVYIDANGNGEQDAEEEGLGGVKLATGRGEIITTDEHGRYHIPAVDGGRWERGRNFILKLDVRSLPKGYKVISDNPIVVRTSPGLPSKINFRVIEEKAQEAKTE